MRSPEPLNIGSTKQLFLDDFIVGDAHQVRRRFHRPVRYPANPIIKADQPWEKGGTGVDITGGTVLFDEDEHIFKMWYRTNQAIFEKTADGKIREASGSAYVVCYAVSKDGEAWDKPNLGLTSFRGSSENNVLPPGDGGRSFIRRPNLIKDYADDDQAKRYKMVYLDELEEGFALLTAYSRDGIHWQMNADPPTLFQRPVIPNGILFGWDPRHRQYVLYHRNAAMVPADVDGRMVRNDLRQLMCSTSSDFSSWGHTEVALALHDRDPADLDIGHLGILSAVLYTDDLYIGFLDTCTVHSVEDVDERLWDSFFKMDHREHRQELVISRDGKSWQRVAPNWEFFRPGLPGAWDANHVIPVKPIVMDDRIWIYYSGSNLSCKSYLPEKLSDFIRGKNPNEKRTICAIGLATMRLDGFASFEGYQKGGSLETNTLVFAGDQLVVNARIPCDPFRTDADHEVNFEGDRTSIRSRSRPAPEANTAESFGKVLVEIEDCEGSAVPGFAGSDCDVLVGEETRHVVSWKGNSSLSALAGKPVRLKFHLQNAAIYSFQFVANWAKDQQMTLACPGCRGRSLLTWKRTAK
jgi:hypothetical protein